MWVLICVIYLKTVIEKLPIPKVPPKLNYFNYYSTADAFKLKTFGKLLIAQVLVVA